MTGRSPMHSLAARPLIGAVVLALLISTVPLATVRAATRLTAQGPLTSCWNLGTWDLVVSAYNGPDLDTAYRGTVHITSSDTRATLPADYAFTATDAGTHTFTVTMRTSGAQNIIVTDVADPSLTRHMGDCGIPSGAPSRLGVLQQPTAGTAGAVLSPELDLDVEDQYGNRVMDPATTISLSLGYGTGTGSLTCAGGLSKAPNAYGEYWFTDCAISAPGTYYIRATAPDRGFVDTQWIAISGPVVRTDHFLLVGDDPTGTGTWAESTSHRVVVYPLLPDGTVDLAYRGTIHFTSTDSAATLPADYSFTAVDAGYHAFDVMFATVGPQTLTVTDATDSSILGNLPVSIVMASPPATATLDLGTATPTITWGGSAVLNLGFSSGGDGATIGLYRIVRGSAEWVRIATLHADTAGKATFNDQPALISTYSAVCEAGCPGGAARIDSNLAMVNVRYSVSLSPVGSGHVARVSRGALVTYRATVRPAVSTPRPRVTFLVYEKVRGLWVMRTSVTRTVGASGVASYARRWSTRGEWYVRARVLADTFNLAGSSAIERVIVR
jgi:hypothetical protein